MSNFNNERGVRAGGTYGESAASGPAPTTAGPHRHDIMNKLDPKVDSTQDRRPMPENVPPGTYGPHRSRIANVLDPRVDSDADHRGAATATGATAPTATGRHAGAGMTGGAGAVGAPEGTYGPHRSRIANALDPRVDSDRDNRGTTGNAATGRHAGTGMTGGAAAGGAPEGTYGPHSSRIANALDPRVDSDMDNRGTTGTGAGYGQPAAGGYGQPTRHAGGLGATGAGRQQAVNPMSGPGPAPNTAGPHRSDLLNKLDPRVDSKTGAMKGGVGAGTGAAPGYTTERRGI